MFKEFVVKKHPRAKQISFKISATGELVITVPNGLEIRGLKKLLTQQDFKWLRQLLPATVKHDVTLPRQLKLRAINAVLPITYNIAENQEFDAYLYRNGIEFNAPSAPVHDYDVIQKTMHPVLRELGQEYLVPWIKRLAKQHNFDLNNVSVRGQRARWGSCNETNDISLNYKLLFLPAALAQHVMLHELCHTRYLDHSARFWRLLEKTDPDTHRNDDALHDAQKYLPFFLRYHP